MKKVASWLLGLGLVVAVSWWGYRHFFPQDDIVIRRLLSDLARTASVKPGDGPLARLMSSTKLADFFAPDVTVSLAQVTPSLSMIHGREDLRQTLTSARALIQQAQISFLDVTPLISPDRSSATVDLTAIADINAEQNSVVQELKLGLTKKSGAWLINRVETVKSLGR